MRDTDRRLNRLAPQMGCGVVHRELVVCSTCDVEIDRLSAIDEEELWQLLHRIGADTLLVPPHPTCPRCGGHRLCLSCDKAFADTITMDGPTLEEKGRLVDLWSNCICASGHR